MLLQLLNVTEPLVCLLRLADGDAPCTGKIYYKMSKCLEQVRSGKHGLDPELQDKIEEIISRRWEYLHSPIHGAAYCLDPEFWEDAGNIAECKQGLLTMIDKLLPTPEDRQAARQHFAAYKAKEGLFSVGGAAAADANTMPAHQWWDMYGSACPELQQVAVAVLSQVSSAVACERNWSTYDYIHNKKRNRLAPARARDLVHVFTNQRLLRKMNSGKHEEVFVPWDSDSEQEEEVEVVEEMEHS